jgi:hypothetical protein
MALLLVLGRPAFGEVDAWRVREDGIGVSDHQPGVDGNEVGSGGGAGRQVYVYWAIGWTGDRFCRERHVTTDPDLAAAYRYALQRQFAGGNAVGTTQDCPPGTPTTPVLTPDLLARDFWDVRILPIPALRIVPDYAVTGKPVYLQVLSERDKHFDVPDPLGAPIGIEATSVYVVDWGDGTVETTTSNGGPWPDGDVNHVYTTSNPARTISVRQQWSATWRAGDQQGALNTLQTSAALTLRVTQVQAVRD